MIDEYADNDDYGPWSLGFTGLPEPTNPVDFALQLTQVVDAIETHNENAHSFVMDIFNDCMRECESLNGYCHDCMIGNAIRYIEQAEKIIGKIHDKMMGALAGTVTDTQMALGTVDQMASYIQQGGDSEEMPTELPFDPAAAELIQNQARLAGEEYRSGEVPSLLDSDIALAEQSDAISEMPPIHTGTTGGGGDGTVACGCPPGYHLGSGFDPSTGKWGPVCKSDFGGPDISCGPVEPPPPPGPGTDCVDIQEAFTCDTICYYVDGKQATPQQILDHCRLCCIEEWMDCGQIVQLLTSPDCKLPEPPSPVPPSTSEEAGQCELVSFSEYVDLEVDYESGQVNGFFQEYSTEIDPIWIPDPSKAGEFIQIEIGQVDPTIPTPQTPTMTAAEMMAQALRNDGKAQACRADIGLHEFNVVDNPIHTFNYCSTKGYIEIDEVLTKYRNVAKSLCKNTLDGTKEATAGLYDLLAGEDGAHNGNPSAALSLASVDLWIRSRKNCIYSSIFSQALPMPDGCNLDKINTGILFQTMLDGVTASGSYRHPAWTKSIDYMRNYDCQYILPSPDIFDTMRLAGRIDKDQWEFGQKVHGYCIPWKEKVVDSQRPTPSFQTVFGWFRAEFIDEEEKKNLLSRVGIESEEDIENFDFISEALPPYSDLIRMMVRDVEDVSVIEKYKLDEDFGEKFKEKVKEWALRQNVSEDIFKRLWRAHWYYPSTTQAFEMYHRLREDTDIGDLETGKLEFNKDDLKQLLKINDVVPGMIDKLIAIAYRPMGLRQIARAYETNAITAKDAEGHYKDIGYNPKDAKTLCEYLQVDSAERRATFLGRTKPSVAAKWYEEGLVDANAYANLLQEAGFPSEVISARVEKSQIAVAVADAREMMKAAKKQYLAGKIDENQYRQKLLSYGIDQDRVGEILRRDQEIKVAKNREIVVGKLCSLVKQGLLTPADYFVRAYNYGYKLEDAALLVESCMIEAQEALQKKIEADIRKAKADAMQALALQEKEERRRKKYLEDASPCKPRPKPLCPS